MLKQTIKEIDGALLYYGDGSGRYLEIVDRLAIPYYSSGGSLSQGVSRLIAVYLSKKGYKNLQEAVEKEVELNDNN